MLAFNNRFYELNNECLPCGEDCQKCIYKDSCDLCAVDAIDKGNGHCKCSTGAFLLKK